MDRKLKTIGYVMIPRDLLLKAFDEHPEAYPRHRNRKIAELADIHLILYTKDIRVLNLDTEHIDFICTSELQEVVPSSSGIHSEKNENAYIIFTSGSTGEPKGVPISRNNLNAFYNAYSHLDWQLDENDRMLQMFELTFDVSIVSFLFPLTIGACICHQFPAGIKAEVPAKAVILLGQHIGAPAKPIVAKGDVVKVGTKIAEPGGFVSAAIHSSVSGKVAKIDTVIDASGYPKPAIFIDVDGDEWEESIDRTETLVRECNLTSEEIVKKIANAGIVGLGGACFPTQQRSDKFHQDGPEYHPDCLPYH